MVPAETKESGSDQILHMGEKGLQMGFWLWQVVYILMVLIVTVCPRMEWEIRHGA